MRIPIALLVAFAFAAIAFAFLPKRVDFLAVGAGGFFAAMVRPYPNWKAATALIQMGAFLVLVGFASALAWPPHSPISILSLSPATSFVFTGPVAGGYICIIYCACSYFWAYMANVSRNEPLPRAFRMVRSEARDYDSEIK